MCSRGSQQKYCVALSEKSWCDSSVCDEYTLFVLAKWLGIHLTRVYGPSSDQSAIHMYIFPPVDGTRRAGRGCGLARGGTNARPLDGAMTDRTAHQRVRATHARVRVQRARLHREPRHDKDNQQDAPFCTHPTHGMSCPSSALHMCVRALRRSIRKRHDLIFEHEDH